MIEIDKYKEYESHGYRFKNFLLLSNDEKQMVLDWRNHEKVRSMMVNKDIIPLENHLKFLESLKDRTDCYYWVVFSPGDSPIGVLDLLHVAKEKDTGELGFYLNPDEAGKGFEFMIECNFFVYGVINLGNNHVTVNSKNKEILLFNKYVGIVYEGEEIIDGEVFYVSKHSDGNYILKHYEEFNLANFARFVRKYKRNV